MPLLTSDNTNLSRPKTGPDLADFGPSGATWIEPAATVQDYLRAATSENTRRAYRADLRHFVDWGGTIPATDVVVAEYLAGYAGELAVSTLTRRLARLLDDSPTPVGPIAGDDWSYATVCWMGAGLGR